MASAGGGRAKQDVVEVLRNKSEEIDAGLSTSRPCKVKAAAHDWLERGLPIGAHAEGSWFTIRWEPRK